MSAFTKFTVRRRIGTRMLFWFLVISVIPCVVLAWLTFQLSSKSLENTVRQGLLVIAAGKAEHIERFALEKIHSVNGISRAPSVADAALHFAETLANSGAESAEYKELDQIH